MRLLRKGAEPPLLLAYRKTPGARYDALPADAKAELRRALVKEQHGLCGFCMQRIEPAVRPDLRVKIAHFVPQHASPARDLDWTNLMASCPGNEGASRSRQHCDTRQGDSLLRLSPYEPTHVATLSYSTHGELRTSREDLRADIDATLNLNDEALCARRREAVLGMVNVLRKRDSGTFTTPTLRRALLECRNPDSKGNLPPFAGALDWWLSRRLSPSKG